MLPPNLKINELTQTHIRLYLNARITEVKAVSVNRKITVNGSVRRCIRHTLIFQNSKPGLACASAPKSNTRAVKD
jgi:hypothetical protein